jgi:hypothetical protein
VRPRTGSDVSTQSLPAICGDLVGESSGCCGFHPDHVRRCVRPPIAARGICCRWLLHSAGSSWCSEAFGRFQAARWWTGWCPSGPQVRPAKGLHAGELSGSAAISNSGADTSYLVNGVGCTVRRSLPRRDALLLLSQLHADSKDIGRNPCNCCGNYR